MYSLTYNIIRKRFASLGVERQKNTIKPLQFFFKIQVCFFSSCFVFCNCLVDLFTASIVFLVRNLMCLKIQTI